MSLWYFFCHLNFFIQIILCRKSNWQLHFFPVAAKSASASPYALENLNLSPLQTAIKITRFDFLFNGRHDEIFVDTSFIILF